MAITPDTNVFLLESPLHLDNKNQLTFVNKEAQFNYFSNLPNLPIDKISYQRKDGVMRVPYHIDTIMNFNYLMYQNSNYRDKWFYAFITNMTYLNDGCTLVSIATDVFQTWQFDLTYKPCFIEREHINVNEDGIGGNLLPEGLETGEYAENASSSVQGLGVAYVIAYSRDPKEDFEGGQSRINGTLANGIGSGLWYYVGNYYKVLETLKNIDKAGFGGSVIAVFTVPNIAVWGGPEDSNTLAELDDPYFVWGHWVNELYSEHPGRTLDLNAVPTELDGYTPRNNKLRTYPYCYLGFTPSVGAPKVYRYEDFENAKPQFNVISEINPNPSVYVIPRNYRGKGGANVSEASTISGYPNISYHTDFYNNWIAQNQKLVNLNLGKTESDYVFNQTKGAISTAQNVGGTVANAVQGNIGGAVESYFGAVNQGINLAQNAVNYDYDIKNQMAQIEVQQMLPNSGSTGGSNATLIGYNLYNDDVFTRYTIRRQFAERIDKYFDMYGYKTNNVKVPNVYGRPTWNYVKTLGAIIEGAIPQQDLQLIKNYFDNGITFWHSTENFLNYNANNR